MSAGREFRGWMVVLPDGHVVVQAGANVDENHIWQIALGWPDAEEIRDAQRRGARAVPCMVVPQ